MAAASRLETAHGSWQLHRYPQRAGEQLQAWCGADLLLMDAALERGAAPSLVVNDEHGALCVALQPQQLWTDSALAALATAANLQANSCSPVAVIWSTQAPSCAEGPVVLRVPKQSAYFEHQLATLHDVMPVGAELICAGMDKHLSPATAATIARYFGHVERHRGARKARVFTAIREAGSTIEPPLNPSYYCPPLDCELTGSPNVFSASSLDIGSRFLIENLPALNPAHRVADLACGNGVLGLCAKQLGLASEVHFFDESAMAVASARANWQALYPGETAHFLHGDGLLNSETKFDLILCNPPFHLGHSVDDFAGRRLLMQSRERLSENGVLVLVANRHLPYARLLNAHFRNTAILAENRKFRIWQAESVA
ncbi:hypothetical protein A3709_09875 [Halioglobus sp. HI00S01]|uniref:class I SAM-dependent methyltransferase n=1 Tax=Halioglobus sp. HI00S01 TaxID=1822214 RepID=UPI0007C3DF69|nr:class I SAM-dependent methyltransferase [Halioglobus sp. HI00S01]KZX53427.1 hypothetical protein A3709_09875 [Halioglobus sp. HI00S01]